MSEPRRRRHTGAPAPLVGEPGRPGVAPSVESTNDVMCELRNDARRLRGKIDALIAQNAAALQLLARIAGAIEAVDARLTEQKDDAENMMAQANENTTKIVEALDALRAALAR